MDITNRFKSWLTSKPSRTPLGTWLMSGAPSTAEAMGYCGFDFLVVDMEHVPIEMSDLASILRAIGCTPADAVVRLAWNDQVLVKRALDAGAQTLMLPFVQTAEEAREAASYMRYPPDGVRGVAAVHRGPLWSADEEVLYLVDIKGRAIHRYDPVSGLVSTVILPEEVGCIGLARGGGFIAGLRSGLWLVGPDGKLLRKLANNPEDQTISRFNDGMVDPTGRFIAGTVDETRTNGNAALYRFDRHRLVQLAGGMLTANGTAFSPDGKTLYHSDTLRYTILASDYEPATGEVSNTRAFARFRPDGSDKGRPDGAAVDVDGCYWTALFEGGRVQRYDPDGRPLAEYETPAFCPTMVAFGGRDRKTLYVTSARIGRPDEVLARFPYSGGLFAMPVEVLGLVKPLFDLNA